MTRIDTLDGLRACAVMLVVIAHLGVPMVPGGFGVTIFFAISGFIITALLTRELDRTGKLDLRAFYGRRVRRLAPAILVSIGGTVGLAMILPNLAVAPLQVLASIGMAQNYYGALVDPTGPLSIHWSLAVEEHFYLAYPLLLGLAWGRATALRVGGIGLALVLPLLARLWLALDHPAGAADYVYRATETRLDSIAWGCALALLLMRQETVRVGLVVGAAGLALLLAALVIRDPLFQASWRYSMQGIGLALLIAWTIRPVTETIVHRALAAWPMALIGRLSFSIYLLHLPMIALAEHLGVGIPGALVLILTASALSYEFVERPFLGGKAPSIKGMISRRAFQVERPLSRGSSELRGSKVP